jgi:hypothetical protein
MKLTAKKPDASQFRSLSSMIWGGVVDKNTPFVDEHGVLRLFEMGNEKPVEMRLGDPKIHVKQRQFIRETDNYDFVLYGGAMRGGKSYIGLWNCIVHLMKWYKNDGLINVRVGIFSESYTTLYDRQISMLSRYLPLGMGKWNDSKKIFKLKRKFGGGEIYFRNLDKPDKYRSVNFAMIFIDEINENASPDVYDLLSTRLEWPGIRHCPFTAACNPGGPGHAWVYDLCINTESETYLRKRVSTTTGRTIPGVFFIQSLPQENPYLDPDYYAKLERLPEKYYKAFVLGDWNSFSGQFFDTFENAHHVVPRRRIPKYWKKFRAIDIGRAHPFVCLWGAMSPGGVLYIYREMSVVGKNVSWCKRKIALLSVGEEYELTIGPHDVGRKVSSREGEHMYLEIFNSEENGGDFQMVVGDKNRSGRIGALYDALAIEKSESFVDATGDLHMAKVIRPSKIRIMSNCKYLINSLRMMQHDEHDREVYARTNATRPGHGDDETDTLGLLWQWVDCSDGDGYAEDTEALTNDFVIRDLLFDECDDDLYANEEAGTSYSNF